MPAAATLAELPGTPQYTVKHVCAQTGIQAVSLRAGERRYAVFQPRRTGGNDRLYSERDIGVRRPLKGRVDVGRPISRAAEASGAMRENNAWPEAAAGASPGHPARP
jgi:DNA-binding transcriptional MerR regulator